MQLLYSWKNSLIIRPAIPKSTKDSKFFYKGYQNPFQTHPKQSPPTIHLALRCILRYVLSAKWRKLIPRCSLHIQHSCSCIAGLNNSTWSAKSKEIIRFLWLSTRRFPTFRFRINGHGLFQHFFLQNGHFRIYFPDVRFAKSRFYRSNLLQQAVGIKF